MTPRAPSIVVTRHGRLAVEAPPYELNEIFRALPGARWDGVAHAWTFPASSTVAAALAAALPAAPLDDAAGRLVEAARGADAAQGCKVADDLAPIPRVVLPPWQHQLRAYHYAAALPACMLALDMGTGKSRVVVDLVVNLDVKRVLILCPLSVVPVWRRQFEIHAAGPVRVVTLGLDAGTVAAKARTLAGELGRWSSPTVIVVNYESAWRTPLAAALLAEQWGLVVVDESHKIKSPSGKASLFCARLRDRAARRVALTGTPMPHSPLDAYAQYRFLDPGIFGTSYVRFRAAYAIMGGYGQHQVVAFKNGDDLARRFYSIAFRVLAGEVLDLPASQDTVRPVTLAALERRVYGELEAELIAEVDAGTVTASNALVKLLRLSQATSGFTRVDDDGASRVGGAVVELGFSKRDVLEEVLDEMAPAEPVVVFCRFHHDLDVVHEVAAALKRRSAELSGRRNELAGWQAGEAAVLAVQIQAGGVGVDLTRARYCVYMSVGYSLGDYEQSRARVLRPGQNRPVVYVHLVAGGTVDETVYDALTRKADAVEAVLGTLKRKGA